MREHGIPLTPVTNELISRITQLAESTAAGLAEGPARDSVETVLRKLRDPLRIAVAGRVNAGKSTLVNALLGQKVAPVGTGETTKVGSSTASGPATPSLSPERTALSGRVPSGRPTAFRTTSAPGPRT